MRTPEALETLVEYGIIEEVLRPLMSGKEAQIYLVLSGGERRVAKVYKEAQDRSFKQRAEYTEGRKSRNSRDARAMAKHSRHGKAQDEAAWRSAEVNAIYRLHGAGVRVPTPHHFVDGVLVMELVTDMHGDPAPRLGDLQFDAGGARRMYDHLLGEVIRMLCAGVVHGDLSEFNVLVGADGPVVIDFPQAVDPASNQSARKLLIRDVDNLHRFLARFVRGDRPPPYAQEMWDLYQSNLLTPETVLRGRHVTSQRPTNTADVLAIIGDAERDHRRKQAREQGPPRGPRAPAGPRVETRGPDGRTQASGPRVETRGPEGRTQDTRGPRVETRGPATQDTRGPRVETRGNDGRTQDNRGPRVETRGPATQEPRGPRVETRGPATQDTRGPRVETRGTDGRTQDNRGPRVETRGTDGQSQEPRGPRPETRSTDGRTQEPRGPRPETRSTDGRTQEPRGPRPETRGTDGRTHDPRDPARGPRDTRGPRPERTGETVRTGDDAQRADPRTQPARAPGEAASDRANDEPPRKRRRRRSGAASGGPAAGSGSRA